MHMKNYYKIFVLVALVASYSMSINAQVTIGGQTEPKKGSMLDMNSDYKGTVVLQNAPLLNNLDLTQFTSVATTTDFPIGSMVYNTNSNAIGLDGTGLYYWTGETTGWKRINSSTCCDPIQSAIIERSNISKGGSCGSSVVNSMDFTIKVIPGSTNDCIIHWFIAYQTNYDGSTRTYSDYQAVRPTDDGNSVFNYSMARYGDNSGYALAGNYCTFKIKATIQRPCDNLETSVEFENGGNQDNNSSTYFCCPM